MLPAERLELDAKLVPGVVIRRTRDDDAVRFADALQPGGDIDAIAVDVVAIDDDVAEIDADPERDPRVLGEGLTLDGDRTLDLHGAGHGIDHAGELDQRAVAHELHDAAVMVRDHRIDHIAAQRLEPGQGARLVEAHEAAVPHHVGGEDRDQLAFDLRCLVHNGHDREIGRRGYGKGCHPRAPGTGTGTTRKAKGVISGASGMR